MIIISLCDYSGAWSKPWKDAGYIVEQVDLQHGGDVRLLEYKEQKVYGIIAAPPCTMFCIASTQQWKNRTTEQMIDGLSVVDACLRAVAIYRPVFWALENPVGRLGKWLGPPDYTFLAADFGDKWAKRTHLWGNFKPPVKSPVPYERIGKHSHRHDSAGKGTGESRSNVRSKTPEGFARAFYEANRMDK